MNPASQYLAQEHDSILSSLRIACRMADMLSSGEPVARDDVRQTVDYFRLICAKCHHGKEERLYFPALQAVGVAVASGPLGLLLIEHGRAARLLDAMQDALDNGMDVEFAEAMTDYAELLQYHFRKEDGAILPLGDTLLSPSRQQELVTAFMAFDDAAIGWETHERLQALVDGFTRQYGGLAAGSAR